MAEVHEFLIQAKQEDRLPKLTVFLRVDGPGSSLDLRLWQQTFWKLTNPEQTIDAAWSNGLPRTVGISINVGIEIIAAPIQKGKLCVESVDYGFCYTFDKGKIPPKKENWLLRIMETFDLDGVKFTIKNNNPALKSAGLGGSAAVTTGVCLLANMLTGNKFTKTQLIGMASMLEQDFGVSITGTQEQSCVMFGGVRDYIWFPFGVPGEDNFYGTSVRQVLLEQHEYHELEKRMDIYFCLQRHSSDVNSVWREELQRSSGLEKHGLKPKLAYLYREALRTKNWTIFAKTIEEYRKVRTELCADYMSDSAWQIHEICKQHNAVCFPLGGGGGSVMVFAENPNDLIELRKKITVQRIEYKISPVGHKIEGIPGVNQL